MTISERFKLSLIKFGLIFIFWITFTVTEKFKGHFKILKMPVIIAPENLVEDLNTHEGKAAAIDDIPHLETGDIKNNNL